MAEQNNQDLIREPIVRSAPASTSSQSDMTREPIVRSSSQTSESTAPEKSVGHQISDSFSLPNMFSQAGKGLYELGTSAYDLGNDVLFSEGKNKQGQEVHGAGGLIGMNAEGKWDPLNAGKNSRVSTLFHKYLYDPVANQAKLARESPTLSENMGHSAAAALPLIGPWAAGLGEQAGTGDVGGAVAKGVTQGLVGRYGPKAAEGAFGIVKAIPGFAKGVKTISDFSKQADNVTGNVDSAFAKAGSYRDRRTQDPISNQIAKSRVNQHIYTDHQPAPGDMPTDNEMDDARASMKAKRNAATLRATSDDVQKMTEPPAPKIGAVSPIPGIPSPVPEVAPKMGAVSPAPNVGSLGGSSTPHEIEAPTETADELYKQTEKSPLLNHGKQSEIPQIPVGKPTVDDVVNQAFNVQKPAPKVPIGEGKTVPAAKRHPTEAAYGPRIHEQLNKEDPSVRGEFHAAATNKGLTNALLNNGFDLGDRRVGGKKGLGSAQVEEPEAVNYLLDQGLSVREIIDSMKKDFKK
jgi:hypothetical protein